MFGILNLLLDLLKRFGPANLLCCHLTPLFFVHACMLRLPVFFPLLLILLLFVCVKATNPRLRHIRSNNASSFERRLPSKKEEKKEHFSTQTHLSSYTGLRMQNVLCRRVALDAFRNVQAHSPCVSAHIACLFFLHYFFLFASKRMLHLHSLVATIPEA